MPGLRSGVMTRCLTCGLDPEKERLALARDIAALSQLQSGLAEIRGILFGPPAPGSSPPAPGSAGARQKDTALQVGTAP